MKPMEGIWFRRDGTELDDYTEIERLLADPDYRRIGRTEVGDYVVSTVWLGTNLQLGDDGPPILFETMIFGPGDPEGMMRYATEEAAAAGHIDTVTWLRGRLGAGELPGSTPALPAPEETS